MSFIDRVVVEARKVFIFKKVARCILIGILPAALFYSIALLGLRYSGFMIMEILRDPAQQSGESSFLGFLSNIGIWLWVSSAAICFFTITTRGNTLKRRHKELLFLTGILSLILAVDDFFMIHDRYIDQNICYLVYALVACTILIRHNKQILEVEGFAFLVAGSFLALSIFTDLVQSYSPLSYTYTQVFEEGFKFIGAATWLYFNARMASFQTTPD